MKYFLAFLLVWISAIYLGAELGESGKQKEPESKDIYVNPKVQEAANHYLTVPAPITCTDNYPPDLKDASGWVYLGDPYHNVFLDRAVCRDLNTMTAKHHKGWWTSSEVTTCSGSFAVMVCKTGNADYYNLAIGLLTLTHELTHFLLDSDNEHVVNCTAERNSWQVLRQFGLPARVDRGILKQVPVVVSDQPSPYNGC